jgi:catechol 2,3-dioxygenase-like lactoylglutathione lyase family enzyme
LEGEWRSRRSPFSFSGFWIFDVSQTAITPSAEGPRLVPELNCRDFARSFAFYCDVLGFKAAFQRPEHRFAYLEREGVELMLEELTDDPDFTWRTGTLEVPFGRGINFQIEVEDLDVLLKSLKQHGVALRREPWEAWYRADDLENGQRQFLVQDPDGYLLRFCQHLGERPVQ